MALTIRYFRVYPAGHAESSPSFLEWRAAKEEKHEDYVMEMPQSGERISGREKMREFQAAYPNPPTMRLRRVIVKERLWVVEIVSDYGGRIYQPVLIIELRDGKIFRDTRYYAEPFEAPEWRARWVVPM